MEAWLFYDGKWSPDLGATFPSRRVRSSFEKIQISACGTARTCSSVAQVPKKSGASCISPCAWREVTPNDQTKFMYVYTCMYTSENAYIFLHIETKRANGPQGHAHRKPKKRRLPHVNPEGRNLRLA